MQKIGLKIQNEKTPEGLKRPQTGHKIRNAWENYRH